jgi:hypothetical protein
MLSRWCQHQLQVVMTGDTSGKGYTVLFSPHGLFGLVSDVLEALIPQEARRTLQHKPKCRYGLLRRKVLQNENVVLLRIQCNFGVALDECGFEQCGDVRAQLHHQVSAEVCAQLNAQTPQRSWQRPPQSLWRKTREN